MSEHRDPDNPPRQNVFDVPFTRQWLDQIADRFEAAWKLVRQDATPPRLEDFVAEPGNPRGEALLHELIGLDIDYRRLRGETPRPEDYLGRFSSLDPKSLDDLLAIPEGAPLPNHPAFLETRAFHILCPHCQVLIELVDDPTDDVLCPSCGSRISRDERNKVQPAIASPSASVHSKATERPKEMEHFGRFQLRGDKPLGKGSFGEVWRAFDPKLQREVALKFPRPGKQKNFLREAQAASHLHQARNPEYVQSFEGHVFGTPAYMSPEQTRDSHTVDRRTDLWALGIILFELLTGERPFRGERDQKLLLDQIRSEDPPSPSKLNSQVPADLDTLCLKCLEKDPSRRFPTAAALAQELHRFLHGEPIHSRPITRWERARKWCQRNPIIASLSASVVLTLLIDIAVSSFFARQSSKRANDLANKQGELIDETKRANQKAVEADQQTKLAVKRGDDLTKANTLTERHLYTAHMNLAQAAWEDNQVAGTLDKLQRYAPGTGRESLRGCEWTCPRIACAGLRVGLMV